MTGTDETHLMCLCFLNRMALFTDASVLLICLYGLIQFNEPPDCIRKGLYPEQWVKGRYVCEMQELMFILPAYEPKKKRKDDEEEMGMAFLHFTLNLFQQNPPAC